MSSFVASAQNPFDVGLDTSATYEYRDLTTFVDRGFVSYQNPCPCDCDDMILSSNMKSGQDDDEVYLYGGSVINNLRCQRVELNIRACNGNDISQLEITFDETSDDCYDDDFYIYRDIGGGEAVLCDQDGQDYFDPEIETGVVCLNPAIEACSTEKVVFYICSEHNYNCDANEDLVSISTGPNCEKEMTFYWDYIVPVPIIESGSDRDDFSFLNDVQNQDNKNTYLSNKIEYKIINILTNDVKTKMSKNQIENKSNSTVVENLNLSPGLYLLQIYNNKILIKQRKILIGY